MDPAESSTHTEHIGSAKTLWRETLRSLLKPIATPSGVHGILCQVAADKVLLV